MRKNKEIRKDMLVKFKQVKGKLFLYGFVYGLINCGLSLIPGIGQLASYAFTLLCVIGFTTTVINVYNGNGENESPVSFFKHTEKLLGNHFCAGLWISLKCTVGFIMIIVGIISTVCGTAMSLSYNSKYLFSMLTESSTMTTSPGVDVGSIISLVGMLLYVAGIIVAIVIGVKYSTISYEIVHDDASGKKAKELVEESKQHLKGHVWQWVRMGIYYGLFMMLALIVMLGLAYLIGWLIIVVLSKVATSTSIFVGLAFSAIIFTLLLNAAAIVVSAYFTPLMICAYEELYKELMGEVNGQGVVTTSQEETVISQEETIVS